MTRTKTIATLWCTALAATLAAYGCGSNSTIGPGTGGSSGSAAGHTGNGAGGGAVIINTGGMTGSGGRAGGGIGGMTGGGTGGMVVPPVDGGPAMCVNNATCTAPFMCDGTCQRNNMNGTRTCTCGNNGQLTCGQCMVPDAGAPPPFDGGQRFDAGPRPDAGTLCPNNARNGGACMVGVSPSPCTRIAGGGGNMQTCTCADVPDAGVDGAAAARYTCM